MPTPVWVAAGSAHLYAWSVVDAGKVKRLRRDGRVTVAACDVRGKQSGEPVSGTARLLDAEGPERVRSLLKRKYGIAGRLALLGSLVRRGRSGTIGIEITLD